MVTMVTGARSTTNIQQIRRKDDKSSKTSKRGKGRSKARKRANFTNSNVGGVSE